MDWSGCELVEVVPGKVSGVPLVKGSRVPADQVVESLDDGETVDEIAFNYDLNPADIVTLKRFCDRQRAMIRQ
jgi:uncharacterized protein (DUF433 family)